MKFQQGQEVIVTNAGGYPAISANLPVRGKITYRYPYGVTSYRITGTWGYLEVAEHFLLSLDEARQSDDAAIQKLMERQHGGETPAAQG